MADPAGYERSYSFTDYQTTHQETPIPGPELDNEFENIERAIGQTQDALDDIRRDDGQLQNGIVTPDSLSPLLNIGFTNRGQWAPGVSYNAGDGVIHGEFFYSARVSHLSTGENAPDLDPGTWLYLFTFSGTTPSVDSGARVYTGDAPPETPPHDGDLWWESDSGKLFVWYEDGDSGQWVEASPGGGGLTAPLPTFATNAAAISGGLAVNSFYKTVTGEVRVVV